MAAPVTYCIIVTATGQCVDKILWDPDFTYTVDSGYSILVDPNGGIGWVWTGTEWLKPNLGQSPPDTGNDGSTSGTPTSAYLDQMSLTAESLLVSTGNPAAPLRQLAVASANQLLEVDENSLVTYTSLTQNGFLIRGPTGFTISTDSYQPLDADLTAIAALAGTSGFLKKTAADTWALDTVSYAPLASPGLTGTPTAPSASAYTNTTQISTGAQVYSTVTTVPENAQTGTTYTLVLADAGKIVTLNNAAAVTLTIPTNASVAFPTGTRIDLAQFGAGQVTVGGAGVTIRSSGSKLKLTGQYSGATLWKKATNEWLLVGDLAA